MSTATLAPVARIDFEQATCSRCGGSGRMPFAAYGGVCFGCNGKGQKLTAKGRAAYRKLETWAETNLYVPASSVEVGQRVHIGGRSVKVTARTTRLGQGNGRSMSGTPGTETYAETWRYGETTIESATVVYSVAAHEPVRLGWTRETLTAAAPVLARMSGATITYADAQAA